MKNGSDTDAWRVPPLAYLDNRPPEHEGERLISQYVTVRDGTKLAVDVHLPGGGREWWPLPGDHGVDALLQAFRAAFGVA